MAAMDCGKVSLQQQYLKQLLDKFGSDSVRVGILQGMEYESRGEWSNASDDPHSHPNHFGFRELEDTDGVHRPSV